MTGPVAAAAAACGTPPTGRQQPQEPRRLPAIHVADYRECRTPVRHAKYGKRIAAFMWVIGDRSQVDHYFAAVDRSRSPANRSARWIWCWTLLAGQGSVVIGHSSPVALLISAARSSRACSGSTS